MNIFNSHIGPREKPRQEVRPWDSIQHRVFTDQMADTALAILLV